MPSFVEMLVDVVRCYRERAARAGGNSLKITIEAEGRLDGDLKVTFHVSEKWGDGVVKGNTLEDVFIEFLRRRGWNEQHQPLCLPNVKGGDIVGDYADELPIYVDDNLTRGEY